MRAINKIKELSAKKGKTLTYIANELSQRLGKHYTIDNLSKKLRKDTIRFCEMEIIAEILDYELIFNEK